MPRKQYENATKTEILNCIISLYKSHPRKYKRGVPAQDIITELHLPPSTLSYHISDLYTDHKINILTKNNLNYYTPVIQASSNLSNTSPYQTMTIKTIVIEYKQGLLRRKLLNITTPTAMEIPSSFMDTINEINPDTIKIFKQENQETTELQRTRTISSKDNLSHTTYYNLEAGDHAIITECLFKSAKSFIKTTDKDERTILQLTTLNTQHQPPILLRLNSKPNPIYFKAFPDGTNKNFLLDQILPEGIWQARWT